MGFGPFSAMLASASSGIPMKSILLTLAALLVYVPLMAQTPLPPPAAEPPASAQSSAIAGMASSARHCVSSDGANVHGNVRLGCPAGHRHEPPRSRRGGLDILLRGSRAAGDRVDARDDAGASNDAGSLFVHTGNGEYRYNLSTNGWSAPATYRIIAALDDGTQHAVDFSLR